MNRNGLRNTKSERGRPFACRLPYRAYFVLSPVLALATGGKYYVAREGSTSEILESGEERYATRECGRCGKPFEAPDMADCTFHETDICSLCCTLEKTCEGSCKKPMRLGRKPGASPA
jgi:hypothetical protein